MRSFCALAAVMAVALLVSCASAPVPPGAATAAPIAPPLSGLAKGTPVPAADLLHVGGPFKGKKACPT